MLPKLVLLASVLLAVGLGYAAAHFCVAHTPVDACTHTTVADHPGMSMMYKPVVGVDTDPGPVVLCLAAVAAILAVIVLNLFGLGRVFSVAGSKRPTALPAVRGSPLPIVLSLRRVAVLRI
ncbi:hypothetical protein ACFV1N_40420 [Streptosporangium canum]|uniref:hypothetical protein n=1 Tax=Streptosporangium canum TaxID=324952 RepID=UPI0036A9042D